MNEVIDILTGYVDAIKSSKSPETTVQNIDSFALFLKSSPLEPIITQLKEKKTSDLEKFQEALELFLIDKRNAFCCLISQYFALTHSHFTIVF